MNPIGMTITALIRAIMVIESGGLSTAIGDNGRSYGCLQIREVCVKDVNRIQEKWVRMGQMKRKEVVRFTRKDCFDKDKSKRIAEIYLTYYGRRYELQTGSKVTDEVLARMWCAGPDGWKKRESKGYWELVRNVMERDKSRGECYYICRVSSPKGVKRKN